MVYTPKADWARCWCSPSASMTASELTMFALRCARSEIFCRMALCMLYMQKAAI